MKKIIAVFFCLFLSGCLKESKKAVDVHECEARLSDIALPLDGKPIKKFLGPQTFVYSIKKDVKELRSFYEQEMERFGWNLIALDNHHETLLIFDKPHRICTVSIRGIGSWKQVYITVVQKY